MSITTTTQVPPAVDTFYDRLLLTRASPYQIHSKFAQKRPLQGRSGDTIKFRRYSSLSTATTPLTEGVKPAGSQLSKTDLTAKVSQYGDFIEITDIIDMTVEDPVVIESVEILGQQMGETEDEVVRDILKSTASVTFCTNGANGKVPTEVTKADVDGVVKELMGGDARMISDIITASDGVGTSPIAPSYWGMCDAALTDDIANVTGYQSTQNYPSQSSVMEAEWGNTGRVRWLASSIGSVDVNGDGAGTSDVYNMFIVGKNAYASVPLQSSAKTIVKQFGSAGSADPLDQLSTAGWKMLFVARILNDNFMNNLRATHS